MKKLILIIILLRVNFCFSQSDSTIIESFKMKLNKADTLFKEAPVFLVTQGFNSKSGKINYLIKVENLKVGPYDIQKTSSIVSPYTAYFIVSIKVTSNKEFGNVKSYDANIGFETAIEAQSVMQFTSCCSGHKGKVEDTMCIGDIKVAYAYQEGSWVFKSVDVETVNKIANGVTRGDIGDRGILNKYIADNTR